MSSTSRLIEMASVSVHYQNHRISIWSNCIDKWPEVGLGIIDTQQKQPVAIKEGYDRHIRGGK